MQAKGHNLSLRETAYLWESSEFKRYIPGNILAFVTRTAHFSGKEVKKTTIFSSLLIEVEFIVLGSTLVSLLSLNFIVFGLLPELPYKHWVVGAVTVVSLLLILLVIGNQYLLKHVFQSSKDTTQPAHNGIASPPIESGDRKDVRMVSTILPNFSFQTNVKLLLTITASLFCFGLGTYFSISSFILLYPPDVLTFIGFFVFSLLIGYLSIITPMGLGIREGIMATGLSKFILPSLAGFSAIFGRIIFIIAELLFLGFTYMWYKDTTHRFRKIEMFLTTKWQEVTVTLSIGLYLLYMIPATFLRYDNFYTGRFDLGNMDQTVWNTLHGRVFQLTDPNGTDIMSRLAFHADFLLVLLAPFYWIWQNPKMLLLIQTLVLVAGAIFVFLIAREILKHKTLALVFALAYLLNPSMNHSNLYDFHAVTLATTFILGAFYFLKKQKYMWLILFLILAGLTKEEVWIITAFFGLYMVFKKDISLTKNILAKKVLGMSTFIFSILIFYYINSYALPHARGGTHFALSYYSDFGMSPLSIIKNLLTSPLKTISILFGKGQLTYIFETFAPLGFLSIFAPFFLFFIAPETLAYLLSNNSHLHEIYYQYTATLTPFIFISAVYGVKTVQTRFPKVSILHATYYLLLTSILAAYFFGPLPGAKNPNLTMVTSPQPDKAVIDTFLQNIPRRFSVAATNNLGSHLSHRQRIFTIPVGIDKADIILFLLNDPFAQPSLAAQKKTAENMKRDKNYIQVFKHGDFIVFEKRNLYLQYEPTTRSAKLFPLSISALQNRDYSGGNIVIEKIIQEKDTSISYTISYPSDGLKQYAVMTMPKSTKPAKGFPVIILNHGYRNNYNKTTAYQNVAEYFASQGFLVVKPDYRGIGNSESDKASFAPLSYPIDVLNLIDSVPAIKQADPKNIFLWGHDVGGEVTLKVLEVAGANQEFQTQIKAAALWSPTINPYVWYQQTAEGNQSYQAIVKKFGTAEKSPVFWQSISQLSYVDDIKTPVTISQGTSDEMIPYQSSIELYGDLLSLNKPAKLFLYTDDNHDLVKFNRRALFRDVEFFRKYI